jgi:peptide/nickel transport system permease protein
MKLGTFITKTGLRLLITYVTIIALFFFIVRILPTLILGPHADPLLIALKRSGDDPRFSHWVEETAKLYGYHLPLFPHQFLTYMSNTLLLNFGISLYTQKPVLEDIALRLPYTLSLYTAATILPIIIGYYLGVVSAKHRGGKLDSLLVQLSIVSYVIPAWLVLLLIYYFLAYLPKRLWDTYIFPLPTRPPGITVLDFESLKYLLWYISPLIIAAVAAWTGSWIYFIRQLIVSELAQDYVVTALAKGLTETEVLTKHVIPNTRPPLIMRLAYTLPGIFGGAYIFELISNWPGIAQLSLNAFTNWDFPLMVAFFTISTVLLLISLFIAEIVIAIVDPRVRLR